MRKSSLLIITLVLILVVPFVLFISCDSDIDSSNDGKEVVLEDLGADTDGILIGLYLGTEDDPIGAIPSLVANDFILIKDFGTVSQKEVTGFTLEVDPEGGTWEYEIKPASGQSFDFGNYRLAFNKKGYKVKHIDFEIEKP